MGVITYPCSVIRWIKLVKGALDSTFVAHRINNVKPCDMILSPFCYLISNSQNIMAHKPTFTDKQFPSLCRVRDIALSSGDFNFRLPTGNSIWNFDELHNFRLGLYLKTLNFVFLSIGCDDKQEFLQIRIFVWYILCFDRMLCTDNFVSWTEGFCA